MKSLTAKDIMNPKVITVPAEMTVHELASFFTETMISGAPVVDANNKLVGVVSLSDIVRHDGHRSAIRQTDNTANYYLHGWEDDLDESDIHEFHVEEDEGLTVADIMTPVIFKVSEATEITEMAETMINGRIHRLIVTRGDEVVGIVTTLDMLKTVRSYTR